MWQGVVMNMARGEPTKLTKANDSSYSLRTTVPKGIVNQFELKEGDTISWEIHPNENGTGLKIIVTPNKKALGKTLPKH